MFSIIPPLIKELLKRTNVIEFLICDLSPDCLEELRGHKVVFVMSQIIDSFCLVYSGYGGLYSIVTHAMCCLMNRNKNKVQILTSCSDSL